MPTLDGVVFVDPRQSQVDIVQAVGRAIRKSSGKEVGTIVLPVFLSHTDRPEVALDQSEFKPIWDVLKALRAHDDDLAEELDALRRELGRRGERGVRAPGKIRFDLPKRIGQSFVRAFHVRVVEQATPRWEFCFGLLERYVEDNGHARVPRGYRVEGVSLGDWVINQRARRGRLSTERVRRLQSLRGWVWHTFEATWEQGFSELETYVLRHGNALVPASYGRGLGRWVVRQRGARSEGRLSREKAKRLEGLQGWVWDVQEAAWSGARLCGAESLCTAPWERLSSAELPAWQVPA